MYNKIVCNWINNSAYYTKFRDNIDNFAYIIGFLQDNQLKESIVSCISSSPDNFCPLDPEVTVLSYELFYEVRMELMSLRIWIQ